ncbi:MAG: hypothetical protein AAGB12_08775 [Pseudomonadota bacterium]
MKFAQITLLLSLGLLTACTEETETELSVFDVINEENGNDNNDGSDNNNDNDSNTDNNNDSGNSDDDSNNNDNGNNDDGNDDDGGNEETPPDNAPPAAQPKDDATAFSETLHPLLVANCAACHADSPGLPNFASNDLEVALNDLALDNAEPTNRLVNLESPRNSKIAVWLRTEHYCFGDVDCYADAELVAEEINKWLELTNKPAIPAANDLIKAIDDQLAFQRTLYPYSQATCGSCHAAASVPLFASNTLQTAYEISKFVESEGMLLADLDNPENSRLPAKTLTIHGCADNTECREIADGYITNIELWKKLVTDEVSAAAKAIGDINADGSIDYVITYTDASKAAQLSLDYSATTHATSENTLTLGKADLITALGDVNLDGYDDFAIASGKQATIIYGAPTTHKMISKPLTAASQILEIIAEDNNQDGIKEISVLDSQKATYSF